jgi:hypothetical protein
MTMRKMIVVLALLPAFPASLNGQAMQASEARRLEACRRAPAVVDRPGALRLERNEAIAHLSRCGREGGMALARELIRLRAISDSALLLKSYCQIARIRDAAVLSAALELGEDGGATTEARIIGFKILITYNNPALASWPFGGFLPDRPPSFSIQDHFPMGIGLPLPERWQESARAVLERVVANPQESREVRYAARRALIAFGR